MNAIELMVEEHKYIKRMLAVIRAYCFKVLQGETVDYNDFFKMIDFVRGYADQHHHGKEEQMLFNKMISELGGAAEKLVRYGMLVEHDLGRLYIANLEAAVTKVLEGDEEAKLDLIANAICYAELLHRHIDKEDSVVYTFAEKNLSKDSLAKLQQECNSFEKQAEEQLIQKKYIELLQQLESKIKK